MSDETPPIINGWTILLHPFFRAQMAELRADVERARARDSASFHKKNAAKRFAAALKLAFEVIPQDPGNPIYRQGHTLGPENAHWRRAKFLQQYRLFFRYDLNARIIIHVWMNDENSKRAYDSKTDAYAVFRRKLASGDPPSEWDELLDASVSP
ncbi:MAG: type II toxin-antitoxin system YhaV family toxin [Elsteraceae bacterium]